MTRNRSLSLAPEARPVAMDPHSPHRTWFLVASLAVAAAFAGQVAFASEGQRAEEGGGFQSNHIFLNGPGGDSISPFSGDAETVVNIGPTLKAGGGLELGLTLHYSTKIWYRWDTTGAEFLKRRGPFGVGWKLHLGKVYRSCRNSCNLDSNGPVNLPDWTYESPDGAQHPIKLDLPLGGGEETYSRTTDSTFIRAELLDPNGVTHDPLDPNATYGDIGGWRLFMGNGVVYVLDRRLDSDGIDPNHADDHSDDFRGWYTTRIEKWDSPNHPVGAIDVTYDTDSGKEHCLKQIDFKGLSSTGSLETKRSITFENETEINETTIEGGYTHAINFPALDGNTPVTASYTFEYSGPETLYFNINPDPNGDPNHALNTQYDDQILLDRILFPFPDPNQQAAYPMTFTYDDNLDDDVDSFAGTSQVTGELIRRTLPTGAAIEYEYSTYAYMDSGHEVFLREVTQKNLYLEDPNTPAGIWKYARFPRTSSHPNFASVTDPFGNETNYLFGPVECPGTECPGWTATLPTSVWVYRGSPTACVSGCPSPPVLLRTTRTRYSSEGDGQRDIIPSNQWTTDEQGKVSGSRNLDRGRFGHFRTMEQYGSGVPTRRTSLTYEAAYEDATLDPNASWWKLWAINKVTDSAVSDGITAPVRRSSRTFTDDGRPLTSLAYADPSPTSPDPDNAENLLTRYFYDPNTANLERSYSRKVGEATPAYGSRFEYADNVSLTKSRVLNHNDPNAAASQAFSYTAKNLTRDAASGVVTAVTDPNGLTTNLYFDQLGRLAKIAPPGDELPTIVTYPTIHKTVVTQGPAPADANSFVQTTYDYDLLGRLSVVHRRTETGCEALQKTFYDIAGRTVFVSEWGFDQDSSCSTSEQLTSGQVFDPNHLVGTVFCYWSGAPNTGLACGSDPNTWQRNPDPNMVYDPLGRISKTITADGEATTVFYDSTNSTVTIGNVDGEPASTLTRRDAYGRVIEVQPPLGATGWYHYDLLGQLLEVEAVGVVDGEETIQPRTFTYDGFGRLLSSTSPEGGTVRFTKYDAAGRLLEKLESDGTKFSFTYDAAGRGLTSSAAADITDPNASASAPRVYGTARMMAQSFYDESGSGYSNGRLTTVDSYDENGAIIGRRKFVYSGLNGRLADDVTTFSAWDSRDGIQSGYDKDLRTCYSYDGFGQLSSMRYPAEASCGTTPADVALLNYSYKNGALFSITDANRGSTALINSVIYNAAGGIRKITHGNGVTTDIGPDVMLRPDSITVTPVSGDPFETGRYAYDGAGNILFMGDPNDASDPNGDTDTFHYDLLSRLVSATVRYLEGPSTHHTYELTYQFDDFGNLSDPNSPHIPITKTLDGQSQSTPQMVVSPSTNRLTAINGIASQYDQRGNLLNDQGKSFLFDQRNRMLAAGDSPTWPVGQYGYDASGLRIMKGKPGTGERTFYVRDGGGNVLTEFTLPPGKYDEFFQKDYFYGLGRVLGMAEEKSPAPVQGFGSSVESMGEEEAVVKLTWTASQETDISAYKIYRYGVNPGGWSLTATVTPPTTSFDQEVMFSEFGSTTYYYRVAAVNQTGLEGVPSRAIKVVLQASPATPSTPSGLNLESHDRSITLRWQQDPNNDVAYQSGLPLTTFEGYNVYRKAPSDSDFIPVNSVPLVETVFHDLKAVDPNLTYSYEVRKMDTWGQESASAATGSGSPGDHTPPAPPTGVRALSGPGAGEITVVWNSSAESDVVGYRLYQKQSDGSYTLKVSVQDPTVRYAAVTQDLQEGQSYTFAVSAVDSISSSALSASSSARPRLSTTTLAPPVTPAPTRLLPWDNSPASVKLTWNSSSGASKYKVWRKLDEEPWSAYRAVFSTLSALEYTDSNVDRCLAYKYLVRAEDPNSNETADPNSEIFVERIFRPSAPVVTAHGGNSLTIAWDGSVGCDPEANRFEIVSWRIKTDAYPADANNPWIEISDPNQHSYTFSNLTTDYVHSFALFARARNLNHGSDPNDAAADFDSMISEDICASAALGDEFAEGSCLYDFSENDPGTGGGGGGYTPDPWDDPGRILLPHPHDRRAVLEKPRHGSDLAGVDADALSMTQADVTASKPAAHAAASLELSLNGAPLSPFFTSMPLSTAKVALHSQPTGTGSRDETIDLAILGHVVSVPFPMYFSPHRTIGSPSAKQFQFAYFHHDNLGSVRMVTDPNGAVTSTGKYLPFGEEILAEPTGNSHKFTGHERDSETDLDYMKARYYSSSLSRFATHDPVQTGNLYSYVHGNPLVLIDPDGRFQRPTHHDISMNAGLDNLSAWAVANRDAYRPLPDAFFDPEEHSLDPAKGPGFKMAEEFLQAAITLATLGDLAAAGEMLTAAFHSAQDDPVHRNPDGSQMDRDDHVHEAAKGNNPDTHSTTAQRASATDNTTELKEKFEEATGVSAATVIHVSCQSGADCRSPAEVDRDVRLGWRKFAADFGRVLPSPDNPVEAMHGFQAQGLSVRMNGGDMSDPVGGKFSAVDPSVSASRCIMGCGGH